MDLVQRSSIKFHKLLNNAELIQDVYIVVGMKYKFNRDFFYLFQDVSTTITISKQISSENPESQKNAVSTVNFTDWDIIQVTL